MIEYSRQFNPLWKCYSPVAHDVLYDLLKTVNVGRMVEWGVICTFEKLHSSACIALYYSFIISLEWNCRHFFVYFIDNSE